MTQWFLRFWDGFYLEVSWAFRRGTTVPSEIFSAVLLLWFAFAIGRPDALEIDVLTLSPLDDLVNVRILALILASVQIVRLVAIGLQQTRVRFLCALFSVFWWTMFAVGFTMVFPGPNIRLGSGLVLALLQSWVSIRLAARPHTDREAMRRFVRGESGEHAS